MSNGLPASTVIQPTGIDIDYGVAARIAVAVSLRRVEGLYLGVLLRPAAHAGVVVALADRDQPGRDIGVRAVVSGEAVVFRDVGFSC